MLDACDRLGMLVIDETFDCWRTGKNPNDYHLFFEDWWSVIPPPWCGATATIPR